MKKIASFIIAAAALLAGVCASAQEKPSLGLPDNSASPRPEMATSKASYFARNYTVTKNEKGEMVLTPGADVRYDAATGREYTRFADGTVQLAVTEVNGRDVQTTVYRIFDDSKTYTKNVFNRRNKAQREKYEVYMGRWSKITNHKTITRYIDCQTGIPFATLSSDVLVQMTAGIELGEQPAEFFVLPENKGYTLTEDGMSKLYNMMDKTK